MNFHVLWMDQAMQALTRAYLAAQQAGDAEAITDPMAEAERRLTLNPVGHGESRGPVGRVLIVTTVMVDYEVFDEARAVVVTDARYVRPRRQG